MIGAKGVSHGCQADGWRRTGESGRPIGRGRAWADPKIAALMLLGKLPLGTQESNQSETGKSRREPENETSSAGCAVPAAAGRWDDLELAARRLLTPSGSSWPGLLADDPYRHVKAAVEAEWDAAKHPRGDNPLNRGWFSSTPGAEATANEGDVVPGLFDPVPVKARLQRALRDAAHRNRTLPPLSREDEHRNPDYWIPHPQSKQYPKKKLPWVLNVYRLRDDQIIAALKDAALRKARNDPKRNEMWCRRASSIAILNGLVRYFEGQSPEIRQRGLRGSLHKFERPAETSKKLSRNSRRKQKRTRGSARMSWRLATRFISSTRPRKS